MKPNQTTATTRRTFRATLGTLAALTVCFLLSTPNTAKAERHFIFDLDFTYVDDFFCGTPLLVHATGKIIQGFDYPELTLVQPIRTQWINPATGKTLTTLTCGRLVQTFADDLVLAFTGAVLIQQQGGTWVDAGLFEYIVTFDPVTGEEIDITIRAAGTHPGIFAEALCAALQ